MKKAADQKMNPLQKLVKMLADVFVPIIPALVASGLLMGLNNVLTAEGLFVSGKSLVEVYPNIADLASMINTFASAAYAFLPILVGFSATKMFGGNPYLGAVMGMIMVSGDLLNAYSYGTAITEGTVPVWHIGALTIEKVGYQGTVLPVLAAAAILAFIEKKLHKVVPEYLDNLLTPALSVLVTAFLTFTVVGGVMRTAGDWITNGILWLHDTLGVVGGFIFGFIYAPLTMTGMHHSLLPVDIQLIAAGGSFLFAIAACNNVAQGGATLAAMFCAKSKEDEEYRSFFRYLSTAWYYRTSNVRSQLEDEISILCSNVRFCCRMCLCDTDKCSEYLPGSSRNHRIRMHQVRRNAELYDRNSDLTCCWICSDNGIVQAFEI